MQKHFSRVSVKTCKLYCTSIYKCILLGCIISPDSHFSRGRQHKRSSPGPVPERSLPEPRAPPARDGGLDQLREHRHLDLQAEPSTPLTCDDDPGQASDYC